MLNSEFFVELRSLGFAKVATKHGLGVDTLKSRLYFELLKPTHTGISLSWSVWRDVDALYEAPEVVSRMSELLEVTTLECAWLSQVKTGNDVFVSVRACIEASLCIVESWANEVLHFSNMHKVLHILECFGNFQMAVIELFDSICDFPLKMDCESRPATQLHFAYDLVGPVRSNYIFADSRYSKEPGLATKYVDRRGSEVSFEELASLYRTSRVSMSCVAQQAYAKLSESSKLYAVECNVDVTKLDKNEEWYTEQEALRFLGVENPSVLKKFPCTLYKGKAMYCESLLVKHEERVLRELAAA